jgi:hypothetical protein
MSDEDMNDNDERKESPYKSGAKREHETLTADIECPLRCLARRAGSPGSGILREIAIAVSGHG